MSVVVPVYNEQDSVGPLVEAVRAALGEAVSWELVFVDDGSRDGTVERVRRLISADARVRLVRLARNYGQTTAMQAGFDTSVGRVVVSMDGDLQNDPLDIPLLLAKLEEGFDLVSGYRVRRQDRFLTRKVPSFLANRMIRILTGVPIRDNGCSLKAYRRELLERLHLYSEMHRFIPATAAATAAARIAEVPVRHHARRHGVSKYGLSRIFKVLIDLLTITMIRSFRERPLVLFAVGGVVSFMLGGAFLVAGMVAWRSFSALKAEALVFPAATFLWFGLAAYLVMLGLVTEVALQERRRATPEPLPAARMLLP